MNGWVRLWIVVSMLWMLPFAWWYVERTQTENIHRASDSQWVEESVELAERAFSSNNNQPLGRSHVGSDLRHDNKGLLEWISEANRRITKREWPEASAIIKLEELRSERRQGESTAYHFEMISWLVGPPLTILVLGLSIAWVARGFKPANSLKEKRDPG